jgi:hypothetical protein
MNRFPGMKVTRRVLLVLSLLAAACGGKESVASKSAAAYREAQAKGVPVGGGHEHGGHATTATTATMDHSAHGTTAGTAPTMDHSAHGAGADAHAGMNHGAASSAAAADHSAHGAAGTHAATADHAAMGHGTTANAHARHGASPAAGGAHGAHSATPRAAGHDQHAGMQHGTHSPAAAADPHAQHRQQPAAAQPDHSQHGATPTTATAGADPHAQHGATGAPTIAPAPRSNAEMQRVQPAATLRRDAFDAPAAVSVSEAAKAAQGGGHEGHQTRGITPGQDRENPPTPMPATRDGSTGKTPAATDHSQHGAAATTIYTCPMHPEVTSDKPGTCPRCGMALVKKNG